MINNKILSKPNIKTRKPNHFIVYNKYDDKYIEVKYLDQNELADDWEQIIPSNNDENLINHFSITLAFLPSKLWKKLKREGNENTNYKIIKDGITRYSIIETNQDNIMKLLYNEIKNPKYDINLLNYYIDNLNVSQYSSWLVIKAKKLINKLLYKI
jgi:hypothetical protein